MKHLRGCLATSLLAYSHLAYANTEKVIFIAPEAILPSDTISNLDISRIAALAPGTGSKLRTSLPVLLPSAESKRGSDSWYILYNLTENQRYELRICWAAIVGNHRSQSSAFRSEGCDTSKVLTLIAATK
jgi:hypothetical protein